MSDFPQSIQQASDVSLAASVPSKSANADQRERLKCIKENCRLVQYRTVSGRCRKCGAPLPAPKEVPKPKTVQVLLKSILTSQEMVIGESLARGGNISRIAKECNASSQIIKNRLRIIYKKLAIMKGSKLVIFASMVFIDTMERGMDAEGVSASSYPCGRKLSEILTETEMIIAQCAAEGMTNKEIGHKLGNVEQTVKNQMRSIFEKLGFSDRLEVALRFHHEKFYTGQEASE